MSNSEASIWIDPGRQSGNPCVFGTRVPVESVVGSVIADGVDACMSDYEVKRRDALVCCAWWTLYWPFKGSKHDRALRKLWTDWADAAWGTLWSSDDESTAKVPDPPRVPWACVWPSYPYAPGERPRDRLSVP